MNHQTRDANATTGEGVPPKGLFGKGIFAEKGRKPPVRPQGAETRGKAPDAVLPGKGVIPFHTGYMELPASPGGEPPDALRLPRVAKRFSADANSHHMATPIDTAPRVRLGPIRRSKNHATALLGTGPFLTGIGGGNGGAAAGEALSLPGSSEADVTVGDGMGIVVCPVSFFHLHAPEWETASGDSREATVYLMNGDAAAAGERSTLNHTMAAHARQEPIVPIRVLGHPVRDGNSGGIVGGALSAFGMFPAVMTPREDALLLMASACHVIPRREDQVSVRRSALPPPLAHKSAEPTDALIFVREAFESGEATPDSAAIVQGPRSSPAEAVYPATWANSAPSDDGAPVRITAVHKDAIDLVALQPVEVVIPGGGPGNADASRIVGPEGNRADSGRYDTGAGILRLTVIGAATGGSAGGAGKAIPPKTRGKTGGNRFQPIARIGVSLDSGEAITGSFASCAITDGPAPVADEKPWTDFIATPPGNTLLIPARTEILVGQSQGNKSAQHPNPLPRQYDGFSIQLPPLGGMPGADPGREPVAASLLSTGGDDYVTQLVLAGQAKDQSLPDIVPFAFSEAYAARALAIAPVLGKQGAGEMLVLLAGIPTRNAPALSGQEPLLESGLAVQKAIAVILPVTGAWERAAPSDESRMFPPPPHAEAGEGKTRERPSLEAAPAGTGGPTPVQETTDPFEILLLDPLRWKILQGEAAFGNPTWRSLVDDTSFPTDRPWRIADGDLCIPWARLWDVLQSTKNLPTEYVART